MEANPHAPLRVPLVIAVTLLLQLGASTSSFASRLLLPMSENIRNAELIVIGDTRKADGNPLDLVVRVSEVLKGDQEFAGKDIELRGRLLSTAEVRVGAPEKGIALLFAKGWEKSDQWPLVEAYPDPARLLALKTLIRVIATKDERKRILNLQKLSVGGNPDILKSTFSELRRMSNPDNAPGFTVPPKAGRS